MLDLNLIRSNILDNPAKSFGIDSNVKTVYFNDVLEACLGWLEVNLEGYIKQHVSQSEVEAFLVKYLSLTVEKPKSNSVFDKATFNFFFNWALSKIVTVVVAKIFELIFVGKTLSVKPEYRNSP